MSNAIATAPSAPQQQFITKQVEVPRATLLELGLRTDQKLQLPVQIPVQPPAAEVATRSRQAVANIIAPAVIAGSSAAIAYALGTGAIDAGLLTQFPANLTLATGVTAALATGSGVYALHTLRQAVGNALQVPRLGLGLAAPQWLLNAASELRVGIKSAATLVSAGVTGAALAIATSTVGVALMSAGTALSEPQTWIAAGVGAAAALGTFLFGRLAVNAAKALASRAAEEVEQREAQATIEAFKQEVRQLSQQPAQAPAAS